MAFSGELEHLPIVDIIQLLYTTRKSGLLTVEGSKGESRIVFSEGRIVSANHLNRKVRIGRVLVRMNAITPEDLEEALNVQKNAGKNRKPLIATLIKLGKVKREEAQKGLKKLVELVVVELVGWTSGTFALDTEGIVVTDECTYLPGSMDQDIYLDAQMILMDALRIFDEKQRDGESKELIFSDEELAEEAPPEDAAVTLGEDAFGELTADNLGLADLDRLERKIPGVFSSIKVIDPADIHRQKVEETLPQFPADKREVLVSFLLKSSVEADGPQRHESHAGGIIFFSRDELFKHSIMTICKNTGALLFSIDDETDIDPIIDRYLSKNIVPILIFDGPEDGLSEETVITLQQQIKKKHPHISTIQITSQQEYVLSLQPFKDGVRAVLPRPSIKTETFIEDTITFLETFRSYISDFFQEKEKNSPYENMLKSSILSLRDIKEAPEISLALLKAVSQVFERAVTLIIHKTDLVAERSIGIRGDKSEGPTTPMKFRISLSTPSVFRDVVQKGSVFFGISNDEMLKTHLYREIGAPLNGTALLLPVKSRDKTAMLIYGDFGQKEVSHVHINALEILAGQTGLALENSLYRRQHKNASQQRQVSI